MKKILFLGFTVSLLVAGSVQKVFAQDDTMRTMEPVVIYAKSNVNKAVTDAFDKMFKDAMDPQWFRMNKNFLVTFITTDTMKNNALFKQNGKLIPHTAKFSLK